MLLTLLAALPLLEDFEDLRRVRIIGPVLNSSPGVTPSCAAFSAQGASNLLFCFSLGFSESTGPDFAAAALRERFANFCFGLAFEVTTFDSKSGADTGAGADFDESAAGNVDVEADVASVD